LLVARLPKHVVKRGSRYYYCARFRGRRIRQSLGADLAEARRKATLLDSRHRRAPDEQDDKPVLDYGKFFDKWLDEYVKQRRTEYNVNQAAQRHKYRRF
jgi:hypothetical protein